MKNSFAVMLVLFLIGFSKESELENHHKRRDPHYHEDHHPHHVLEHHKVRFNISVSLTIFFLFFIILEDWLLPPIYPAADTAG